MKYVFQGQANPEGKPDGFARVITEYGTITEGNFTPDGRRNGWCVTYCGNTLTVVIGWFEKDKAVGNFMELLANSAMAVSFYRSGWYENDKRVGDMKGSTDKY